MPFGRIGRHSNRSQHALPVLEQQQQSPPPHGAQDQQQQHQRAGSAPVASSPDEAAASPSGFGSRSSLETRSSQRAQEGPGQGQQQQQPPPPPPHHLKPGSAQGQGQGAAPPFDLDVAAHHAQHHHRPPPPPPLQTQTQTQTQTQHAPFSAPADDPHQVGLAISSPSTASLHQDHHHHQLQLQQHQQQLHLPALPHPPPPAQHLPPPPPPPEPKRSTRKLIKGIFSSSSRDSNQAQSGYDNTSGLARRQSKRASQNPNYRFSVSQLSQVSAEQDPAEWHQHQHHQQHQQLAQPSPHHVPGQPSPLAGVGEIDEEHQARLLDAALRHQGQPDPSSTTIRPVGPNEAASPYRNQPPLPYQQQQQQQQQQIAPQLQVQKDLPDHPAQGTPEPQHSYPKAPPQGQYRTILPQQHTGQSLETSSQISRDSPVVESATLPPQFHPAQNSRDNPLPPLPAEAQQDAIDQEQNMAPPSAGSSSRRSQDADKAMRTQEGQMPAPPGYRHGQPVPQPAAPAFRGASGQERMAYDGQGEQGRNSPQPEREDPEKAFKDLLTKYKNVKRLYFENKAQIEQMTGQIEQLQNAVANQRITASRTALDDGEYSTRFNRLNGAVNNMAFNIRKDWRLVPRWLDRYVSQDALKTGKQEMTAVGRAVITRWIVEEVFNRCFHPGLDPELSRRLKEIELGIRRNSYTLTSQEEFDALTSKVVSWRMATLDGLSAELNSPAAADVRAEFTARATESLLATLTQYLDDPPPAGIEGSASMIMELAVGIAANMPLESRDVVIRYPLPGDPVEAGVMEVEKGGLPPLEGVPDEEEGEGDEKNGGKEKRKGNDVTRVRLAGFVVLEVRGRQVLMKAPVWTLS